MCEKSQCENAVDLMLSLIILLNANFYVALIFRYYLIKWNISYINYSEFDIILL